MSKRNDQPENPFDVTKGQSTALTNPAGPGISAEGAHLIELLRNGNEAAVDPDRFLPDPLNITSSMTSTVLNDLKLHRDPRPDGTIALPGESRKVKEHILA